MNIKIAFSPHAKEHLLFSICLHAPTTPAKEKTITALSCIEQAVKSGYLPEKTLEKIKNGELQLGVFSTKVPLLHHIKENDRLEIYRPLKLQPMQKRINRTKQKK